MNRPQQYYRFTYTRQDGQRRIRAFESHSKEAAIETAMLMNPRRLELYMIDDEEINERIF